MGSYGCKYYIYIYLISLTLDHFQAQQRQAAKLHAASVAAKDIRNPVGPKPVGGGGCGENSERSARVTCNNLASNIPKDDIAVSIFPFLYLTYDCVQTPKHQAANVPAKDIRNPDAGGGAVEIPLLSLDEEENDKTTRAMDEEEEEKTTRAVDDEERKRKKT